MPNPLLQVEAVKELADALSIKEATKPPMEAVGKALGTIFGLINVPLLPVEMINLWASHKKEAFTKSLSERIESVPNESRQPPKKRLLIDALEGAILCEEDGETALRDMFFNLIATGMDSETQHSARLRFSEIIRRMTPFEGQIVTLFSQVRVLPMIDLVEVSLGFKATDEKTLAVLVPNFTLVEDTEGYSGPDETSIALESLRLQGLIEVRHNATMQDPNLYGPLEKHPYIVSVSERAQSETVNGSPYPRRIRLRRKAVALTSFGREFCKACVVPHGEEWPTGPEAEPKQDIFREPIEPPVEEIARRESQKVVAEFEQEMRRGFERARNVTS